MTALVLRGDAAHLPLPDGSVDLIVTSPPYFSLRSYSDNGEHYAGQIGSEETSAEYIAALLRCTREWMRVLKPSGSIFVNLGDKFSGGGMGGHGGGRLNGRVGQGALEGGYARPKDTGVRDKSLLGLPWRYALGCMDELGLILRRDIIWSKPNGLPESVTDRCRSSHEYLFHFTKQPRYFSAVDEIREPASDYSRPSRNRSVPDGQRIRMMADTCNPLGKLPGSVWDIPSMPLVVPAHLGIDHFAAFPVDLPRRCILGWSPVGICTKCGEGRRPISVADAPDTRAWALAQRGGRSWHGDGADPKRALGVAAGDRNRRIVDYACACPDASAPTRPALIADPFGGTGTTAMTASVLGRIGVTFDRSMGYCRLARWRTRDPAERARALGVPKPPPVPEGQASLFDLESAS